MPIFLKQRDTNAKERMDDPDCSRDELFNTYKQFSVINSLISRWKLLYDTMIKPSCRSKDKTYTLLDIGFGGGDLPIKIARWSRRDGITLDITAIETDPRACRYVTTIESPPEVTFRHISSSELLSRGHRYDFVISNHLLHHLGTSELPLFLEEARRLSRIKILFNDIERSDTGYLLFNIFSRPIFRSSFITDDGLTSIRRSYTADELRRAVPAGWQVERIFPFRLLLSRNLQQPGMNHDDNDA